MDQIRRFEREFSLISDVYELSEIFMETGCLKPCQFMEYQLARNPLRESGSNITMTLILTSSDITSKKEEILFDLQSFVSEFGGALGLFLGFSFVLAWDGLVTMSGYILKINLTP